MLGVIPQKDETLVCETGSGTGQGLLTSVGRLTGEPQGSAGPLPAHHWDY